VLQVIVIFLSLFLTACQQLKQPAKQELKQSKLLFRVEKRDITIDEITEYRVFDNGYFNKTIIHSTNKPENLNLSWFHDLNGSQLTTAQDYLKQLQNLDYQNDFPWKEEYFKRGNVIKIQFPDQVKINYATKANQGEPMVSVPQTFYYYQGHEDSPELFKNLMKFIEVL